MGLEPRVYEYRSEEVGFEGSSSRLIVPHPEFNLEVVGTSKNPQIKKTNANYSHLLEMFQRCSGKEPKKSEIERGFSGFYDPTGYHLFHVSLTPLPKKESERILRLVAEIPTFREKIIYTMRKKGFIPGGREDPYKLGAHVQNMFGSLKELCKK